MSGNSANSGNSVNSGNSGHSGKTGHSAISRHSNENGNGLLLPRVGRSVSEDCRIGETETSMALSPSVSQETRLGVTSSATHETMISDSGV